MLLAASESAVTKNPRLRFTMSRSSSVNPCGFFQRAMSRFMFTSCGIQWFAQPARYFSQAHLYLKGTSWFTSVRALMTRLSSARTRVCPIAATSCLQSPKGEGDLGSPKGALLPSPRPSPEGEEVMLPDGVEWIVCRPTVGAAIGVSSSKLSILNRLLGLAPCGTPLFIVVLVCGLYGSKTPSGGGFRLRHEALGQCLAAGGAGFPVQRLQVLGARAPAQRAGEDVVELPAKGGKAVAAIGEARQRSLDGL